MAFGPRLEDRLIRGSWLDRPGMNILSIQSHVAYGHAGNSAAVFPLQRIGVEVWPVHTVQFSNHSGYGARRGPLVSADAIRLVVRGIEERGALGKCDGVLSGYLGSPDIGEVMIDAVARVKSANPDARFCCDPVIGDTGRGIFVRQGVPEFIKARMLPIADIVTPNQFELEYLADRTTSTMEDLVAAIDAVHARGPRVVLVTSMHINDTPDACIDLVVSDRIGRYRLRATTADHGGRGWGCDGGFVLRASLAVGLRRPGDVARRLLGFRRP
jgi:pyridoxine kinase